jgi:hypothetical protein
MRPHREPHRESTKSRERMQQEAAERARNEAEMAEKIMPESRPRERRSSSQKEARPHISTEDLGEKRERRKYSEGATPVDIPPSHYRSDNPPYRTSVSPPDGVPRPGPRYGGSAPAPVPSATTGPTTLPYGSPKRRHSTSGPQPPHVYTQEPLTYGDSGYSSPSNPHPSCGYHHTNDE